MRWTRTFICRRFTASVVIALLTISATAQQLKYLALKQSGQASVAIDYKKAVAYIIDLGRSGDGNKIVIPEGYKHYTLLDYLVTQKVRDLVFICSHPHLDHNGGIRALFSDPRNFLEFASVTVIDDSSDASLFPILKESLGSSSVIISHKTARNRNAMAELSHPTDEVFIENIPYEVNSKARTPHGRSVVTHTVLKQKQSTLDFDDANSQAVRKILDKVKGERFDLVVLPHHGSFYQDIRLIFDELEPKQVVIAVNDANQYGHPDARTVRLAIERVGPKNVMFTGSDGVIDLGPEGVTSARFTAAQRSSYDLFILPNWERDRKKGTTKTEADYKYLREVMSGDDEHIAPPRHANAGPEDLAKEAATKELAEKTLTATKPLDWSHVTDIWKDIWKYVKEDILKDADATKDVK